MPIESLVGAAALAAVHLFASKFRFLDVVPRSRWLSIAGGVAVAYALVHLLPELQEHRETLAGSALGRALGFAREHLVWLTALLGLVVFYGLEKAARPAKRQTGQGDEEDERDDGAGPAGVFWLHVGSYGAYNALIGYLLVREDRSVKSLALFLVGIGLHFVVNDHGLRQDHMERYRRLGRWVLSAAVLVGWAVGVSTEIHGAITASAVAFLAGGILLNTFKEELPEERESRFWAFALGALAYAAVLTAI